MYDALKYKTPNNESACDEALSESVSNTEFINELLVMVMVYDEEDEKDNEEKESGRPDYLKSSDTSLAVLRGCQWVHVNPQAKMARIDTKSEMKHLI